MGRIAVEIPREFRQQMTRMMGLKFAPSDLLTHWEALSDVPAAVLAEAVSRAQKTRSDFPSPVELRQDCDAVAHLVRFEAPEDDCGVDLPQPFTVTVPGAGTVISITREWRYYCDDCEDAGMRSMWCGEPVENVTKLWQMRISCDRTKEHAPHEFVAQCACWDTNRALIRKREAQQKYADAAKTKR
jgi:hypothetical protein